MSGESDRAPGRAGSLAGRSSEDGLPENPVQPVAQPPRALAPRTDKRVENSYQPAPALEQVRTPIGCLNLVTDHMGQRSLDDLARMVRLLGHPVSKARPEAVRHGHDLEFPEQPAQLSIVPKRNRVAAFFSLRDPLPQGFGHDPSLPLRAK